MLTIPFTHFASLVLVNSLLKQICMGCGGSYCMDRDWGRVSPAVQAGTLAGDLSSYWSVCACCPLGNHTERDGRVAWWDNNNTGENIPRFQSCYGWFRQRNSNCWSKIQRWEEAQPKQVEKWGFVPSCRSLAPLLQHVFALVEQCLFSRGTARDAVLWFFLLLTP